MDTESQDSLTHANSSSAGGCKLGVAALMKECGMYKEVLQTGCGDKFCQASMRSIKEKMGEMCLEEQTILTEKSDTILMATLALPSTKGLSTSPTKCMPVPKSD